MGGLAERTKANETTSYSDLYGIKDDIGKDENGQYVLIKDLGKISQNNVMREMREELGDLGITDVTVDPTQLEPVPMPKVKDDNYIINILMNTWQHGLWPEKWWEKKTWFN